LFQSSDTNTYKYAFGNANAFTNTQFISIANSNPVDNTNINRITDSDSYTEHNTYYLWIG
jgi:hypothetical protein